MHSILPYGFLCIPAYFHFLFLYSFLEFFADLDFVCYIGPRPSSALLLLCVKCSEFVASCLASHTLPFHLTEKS